MISKSPIIEIAKGRGDSRSPETHGFWLSLRSLFSSPRTNFVDEFGNTIKDRRSRFALDGCITKNIAEIGAGQAGRYPIFPTPSVFFTIFIIRK